jgi:Na+-transporting NADH:ubiquinone oxidoreductase subunit NqrF
VVKLSGSAFQSGAKVAFSGTGVTDTLTSLTSTTIELKVTVSKTAAIAKYSVTVTDPDGGKATCTNCFSVTKAAGPRLPAAVRAPATRSAHVGTSEVAARTVGRSAVTLRFPARLAAVTSRRAATGIDRTFGVRLQ